MAEFSTTTRLIATLLLIVVSVIAWKWLQSKGSNTKKAGVRSKASKKRKKKPAKKSSSEAVTKTSQDEKIPSTTPDASAKQLNSLPELVEGQERQEEEATARVDKSASSVMKNQQHGSEESDSDEDLGLTAAQILRKRTFKPAAVGRSRVVHEQPDIPKYELNHRVLARYQQGDEWFPATVFEVRRQNEYNLKYDDGAMEYHVPYRLIKPYAESKSFPESTETQGGEDRYIESHHAVSEPQTLSKQPIDNDLSEDAAEGIEEDDGWQVVGSSSKKGNKTKPGPKEEEEVLVDGLTKRQRENRRKKERQKEKKETLRAQVQEHGLHARWGGQRNKFKHMPPPTSQ